MRLPLIPPVALSAKQRALYDGMRAGIAARFKASLRPAAATR
jgi:hypothetical protein